MNKFSTLDQDTPFDEIAGENEGVIRVAVAFLSNPSTRLAGPNEILEALQAIREGLYGPKEPEQPALPDPKADYATQRQIKDSINDEWLRSFIDGKLYKTLKRHLTLNGLDERSYKEKYGLPMDYPMVAPAYAARRSELAKSMGLGRRPEVPTPAVTTRGKKTAKPATTVN